MFQTRSVLRWSWQRHAPKSRLLNFKGTLKTGTWDEKSREIPCPSKLKEPEISNFNSSKHATLNCNYYCIAGEKLFSKRLWHRLRPPAVVVLDVHRGLRRQQQLGALHAAVECCICSGVRPQHRRRRRHHPLRLAALSSRAVAAPGRPRPRPSPGERRRPPCGRRLLPRAARPSGASPGLEESVEAAPVAAQVAPHRRQVAVSAPPRRCCRLGAGRNAAEMKFLSSFDLYVLSSLSPSLLLMEIILNKLETELIELL